jgi:glycosyltransferase involved in cell wall biosynthesis
MSGAYGTDLLDEAGLPDSSAPGLDEILGMHGTEFVQCAYRMIVVRNPDPAGTSFYLGRLLDGIPKVQILSEMAGSKEARELAVNPPGLARARFLLRLARLPLIGRFIGRMLGVEGNSRHDIRLRVVEELLHRQLQEEELARQTPVDVRPDLRALIEKSDLFDPDWYRRQSPELGAEIDFVDHFLARGGVEGRSASEKFDCRMYLDRYVDVRRSGMNPLVHFLAQGEQEGRRSFTVADAREYRQLMANFIIKHEIHCLKAPEVSAEVAVLVTYSTDGYLRTYVADYIGALRRHGVGVILVIVSDRPVKSVAPETLGSVSGLFVRERKGDDFAAWAHVLQLHPELYGASILYLLDDSAFGPLGEAKFTWLIGQVRASAVDMIELRDNTDDRNAVHACFRAFKPRALSSVAFQRFVNESGLPRDPGFAPQADSMALTAQLRAAGLKVAEPIVALDLAAAKDPADGALSKWNKITHIGFPFVDLKALDGARTGPNWAGWQQLLEREGYDVRLLDRALGRVETPDIDDLRGSVSVSDERGALLKGPRPAPSVPLRVAFIGPWNHEGEEGLASRAYVSALWHTEFLLNVHPVRRPFHHFAQLTPTVDCLSFSGEADLVIVHLSADEWPRLLNTKHWEILSGARKIVGAWAFDGEKVPESWRPAIDTMDGIWAPSQYCADVIQRSTWVPVEVVPLCLPLSRLSDAYLPAPGLHEEIGIPQDSHVILCCIGSAATLERQNPSGLLAAFGQSGLASEGWVLVICAGSPLELTTEGAQLQDKARQIAGAYVIDIPASPEGADALLAMADIYASAHRAENVGVAIAKAMAHGKSVVATDFGGSTDFLDATCGYPVPYVLRAVPNGLCAEVDIAALSAALRKAAVKIIDGDVSIGLAAKERIRARNSSRQIAQRVQRTAFTLLGIK